MTVYFIGAGPGAPDLITVRGLKLIERCPVCLYAGSLVPEEIVQAAPADALVMDTAPMHLDEIIEEMKGACGRPGRGAGAFGRSGDLRRRGRADAQARCAGRSTTRWCRACRPLPERRRSSRPN
jgi:precorrin-4 methylase